MAIPEWLLALTVTLFVLDCFIPTEWLSWLSLLCLSGYVTWKFDPPLLWGILTFIAVFALTTLIYYLLLRKLFRRLVSACFMRNAKKDILERLPGMPGTIQIIQGKTFVRLNSELWNIVDDDDPTYQNGEKVVIVANRGGLLEIKRPVP